jgi:hypothetical protein
VRKPPTRTSSTAPATSTERQRPLSLIGKGPLCDPLKLPGDVQLSAGQIDL